MSDPHIFAEFVELLGATVEDFSPEGVVLDDALKDDLGFDSLIMLEVVVAIEERWGISVPEKEAEKLTTVRAAVDYVAAKVNGVSRTA
ncbi:acyl carrier protein [Streptomyces paromomycinus]|uniref:Acyl carrier protein n=1 Tax=Streptomyces paromomycinus TaxID=92743 RepID=A0A401VV91_STREY|nr:acyl carrier protein [Streptomyces paromomycinus]GCD40997.1 acyl carrier protein [Streptomyces paromomycinus]